MQERILQMAEAHSSKSSGCGPVVSSSISSLAAVYFFHSPSKTARDYYRDYAKRENSG